MKTGSEKGTLMKTDWFPSLIMGIFTLATSICIFLITVFFSEKLGFTGNQIGILFSLHALTGVFAALPSGIGNDRITSRTLVVASLIMQAASFVLMGIVKSYTPYLPVFFMWSLSTWVFRWSLDVQFLKTDSAKEIGNRVGFYQGLRFVGAAIGTIGSGYLIRRLDYEITLMLVGGVCLLLAVPAAFLAPTPVSKADFSDYKADFSDRNVIFFALWLLLFASHWGAEQTCYAMFLRKHLHLAMDKMGWYISAEFLAIIITLILAGDRIGKNGNARKMAIWGLAASGIGHIGMIFQPIAVSLSFRVLHGIGDGYMMLVMYYGISKLFSVEHLGGNTGLINLAMMIGYIIGSLVYGSVGEAFGYEYPLWISGVLTTILMFPLLSVRLRLMAAR